jgi:hypothetical protein
MSETIDNGAEYGLYALAVRDPAMFREAERFTGAMLANEPRAARHVKALVAGAVQQADGSLTKKLADALRERGILPGRNPDGVNDDLEKLLHVLDEALTANIASPTKERE